MEIARDIIVALSAVAGVAIFGLTTWRKELVGRAKFETAKKFWSLIVQYKNNFEYARGLLIQSREWSDRIPGPKETPNESDVLNTWHATIKRIELVREMLIKVNEIQWEAEILFDSDSVKSVNESIKTFGQSYSELSSTIREYFDITHREAISGRPYSKKDF